MSFDTTLPGQTDWTTLLIILGLTVVTIVSRSLFFLSSRELPMPRWFRRGLRYAPAAALASIVIPAIVMTPDNQLASWNDARLYGALAGAAWFFYRRSVMGTILVGMAVYLPLHLGVGW